MACTKIVSCAHSRLIPGEIHNTAHLCSGLRTKFTNMYLTWPIHVPSASPFPITNIPFGIFSTQDSPTKRVGIAIGAHILDLSRLEDHGLFEDCLHSRDEETPGGKNRDVLGKKRSYFSRSCLNDLATLPSSTRTLIRKRIIDLLQEENSTLFVDVALNQKAFFRQNEATMHLPMAIGDFTDFMCSRTHVDNCARLAGIPSGAPPSFYSFPSGYNGRSSSVVISGTSIHRPCGMLRLPTNEFEFAPSRQMDFELELGFFVSKPVEFGHRIKSADEAKEHIFGFVLLNDWSARDIQFTEMTPLGPFNGKGSGTTISPWVVTLDALEYSKSMIGDEIAQERMSKLPDHLRHRSAEPTWSIDVEVSIKKEGWENAVQIGASNLKDLYWTPAQMLAHHASSGCGMRTGDLLGTGTISSPKSKLPGTSGMGCLHEMTSAGTNPFNMSNGDATTWLQDGYEVVMAGKVVRRDGGVLGFGECRGQLEKAL